MRVWIDPKETATDAWGTPDADSDGATPTATVVERALTTQYPIQYTDGAYLTPTAAGPDGRSWDRYARIQFNCAVDRAGTVKLTARGYRWGGDGPAMRFKSLLSREPEPTETVPFDTYERWLRFQRGDVTGFEPGDAYVDFEPTDGAVEERRKDHEWAALRWPIRLRLAELELVRNAPFARYRLRECDEWDAVRGTLRWKPTAFGDAEGHGD
jgi:hypothetical protein